jgi:hypothetical protein
MKRYKAASDAIRSVGYNAKKEILEIEFRNGGIYQYTDFPEDEYEEFVSGDVSMGRYFLYKIKDWYDSKKIK